MAAIGVRSTEFSVRPVKEHPIRKINTLLIAQASLEKNAWQCLLLSIRVELVEAGAGKGFVCTLTQLNNYREINC